MEPIRLQKFFTDCGVMSRRAAEAEIEKGNVTVNGTVGRVWRGDVAGGTVSINANDAAIFEVVSK